MWDTSEYITAAYTFGLPHPPGNPFFVLLGRVFSLLPIAPNIAMRINTMAALCSAIAAGIWFLITERVLASWLQRRWQRITGGAIAVLIGSTEFTVWAQSVVNEKVYTVSLVGIAIIAWLTVRWCDNPDGPKADRLLVLVGYLSGLGYANHMAGFLALPAVCVAVLVVRPRTFLRWKLVLAGVLAIVLGMTPFLTQPIRAAYFPRINEGEVTGCTTKLAVGCTFSKTTYDRFIYNFNRDQYGKPSVLDRQISYPAQLGMWWTYFRWQWLRDPDGTHPGLQAFLTWIFLLLGLLGGYVHWRRDRRTFWFFASLIGTLTFVLIFYLNFKYGFSQAPDLGQTVPREVRDRDYFFVWSFSAASVWFSLGLLFVWKQVAELFGMDTSRADGEIVPVPRGRSWIAASPLLLIAFIPLVANRSSASRHGQTDTRDFAHDLLESVEPYGVLITVADNDSFPLWYAQEVEGVRKDVTVLCTSLLNTDWYTRQFIRNPIRPYDILNGPPVYAGRNWPMPRGPLISLTFAQSDAAPPIVQLTEPQELKTNSGYSYTIHPRDLGDGYHGLERADLFVLYIIRDAFPSTPVFFSRTDGSYPEDLGFGSYLVTTGLARKLVTNPPTPSPTMVNIPGDGWLDVSTTYSLWTQSFAGTKSLQRLHRWVDKPSIGIPYGYVRVGSILAAGLAQSGRESDARQVMETTLGVARSTQLTDLLAATTSTR
jgi:hypothetical protein